MCICCYKMSVSMIFCNTSLRCNVTGTEISSNVGLLLFSTWMNARMIYRPRTIIVERASPKKALLTQHPPETKTWKWEKQTTKNETCSTFRAVFINFSNKLDNVAVRRNFSHVLNLLRHQHFVGFWKAICSTHVTSRHLTAQVSTTRRYCW